MLPSCSSYSFHSAANYIGALRALTIFFLLRLRLLDERLEDLRLSKGIVCGSDLDKIFLVRLFGG